MTSTAYVYALIVDGIVRYIGKGRGLRAKQHLWVANSINRRRAAGEKVKATHFYNRLAKAVASGAKVDVRIIADGMTDEQAFAMEIREIEKAEDVWNATIGGEGLTSEAAKALWTPEFRQMHVERTKRYWQNNPDQKLWQSAWIKSVNERLWADDSDFRAKQSARVKAQTSTPEGRALMSETARQMWTAEFRAKRSAEVTEQMNQRWTSNEERQRLSAKSVSRWADPKFRARNSAAIQAVLSNDEQKARVREQSRQRWSDPEFKARTSKAISEGRRRQLLGASHP